MGKEIELKTKVNSRFFTARCYASTVYATALCLSRHMSEFYQNGWNDRAGFGNKVYSPLILHCYKGIRVWSKIRDPLDPYRKFFNVAWFLFFFHYGIRQSSQVLSTQFNRRPPPVYHTERSLLFTIPWAWQTASRGVRLRQLRLNLWVNPANPVGLHSRRISCDFTSRIKIIFATDIRQQIFWFCSYAVFMELLRPADTNFINDNWVHIFYFRASCYSWVLSDPVYTIQPVVKPVVQMFVYTMQPVVQPR